MNHKKLSTILALATFLFSSLAEAQEAPKANEQAPRVFDFHFEGGDAFQLQTAIQQLKLNFIVPEKADEVHIPKFSVRHVQPKELFNALNLLLGTSNPQYIIKIEATPDNEIWVLKMYATSVPSLAPQAPERVVTRPINIAKQLETTSIEGLSSLIRSTVEAGHEPDSKPNIDIKFHKETKVLILSGTLDTVSLASSAIGQISTKEHTANE